MSGHSKWHKIREKKGSTDAKRGKLFTQMAKAITVAARKGGGDPKFNFSLRMAIDKAKEANVPKDNIEKAIKRGTGEIEGAEILEKRYEGYGPDGVAVIVDTLTDNSNRTFADLKHIFSKNGGNMEGSVAWQFEQKGILFVKDLADKAKDEEWMLQSIDAGAEDVQTEENDLIIITGPKDLQKTKEWLEEQTIYPEKAELEMIPKETIPSQNNEKLEKFLDAVEDYEDVEKVYHNAAPPETDE